MTAINTNVKSLVAKQALEVNNRSLSKAMAQLSTGKRVNSAVDDAAGLAIGNKKSEKISAPPLILPPLHTPAIGAPTSPLTA